MSFVVHVGDPFMTINVFLNPVFAFFSLVSRMESMLTIRRYTCTVLLTIMCTCAIHAQSSWDVVGKMFGSRQYFDAYPISSNEIIAIGGFTSTSAMSRTGVLSECDIFNIDTRKVVPGRSMSVGRAAYASVVMPDGGIVVLGGAMNSAYDLTSTVERFDPQTREWTVVGTMVRPRMQHQAIPIDDHRILVVGGRLQDISVIGTSEIFDLQTGASTQIAEHPYHTSMGRLMKTKTGQLLSFGGREGGPGSNRYAEVYELDTTMHTWKSHVGFPTPLYHPAILTLDDGRLFTSGGAYQESGGDDELSDGLFLWDGERFDSISSMTMGRVSHLMVQYDANTVLITGGQAYDKAPSRSCDLVNTTTGEVRRGPDLNTGRSLFALVRMGNAANPRIFALGGRMDASRYTDEIEELSGCIEGSAVDMYTAGIIPAGQASIADRSIVLTDAREFTGGAVWARERVPVVRGFSTSFAFNMTSGNDNAQFDGSMPGADGIAFVIQNGSPSPIGGVGEGIGYDKLTKALVVEFDTYKNPAFGDPDGNHIAVQTGGEGVCRSRHTAPYLLGMTSAIETFVPDGRIYYGRIDYQGDRLSVYLDRTGAFAQPVLIVDSVDIGRLLGLDADGTAWIGFTSSTGQSVERHTLLSWGLGGCRGVVSSVHDEWTVAEPAAYIVPMPSSGVARLFSNVEFSGAIMVTVNDVTGMMIGNVTVGRNDLRNGLELPFRLAPGSYYVRMTAGGQSVAVPWIVLP